MTPGVAKRASRDLHAADATAAGAPWYPGFWRRCILRRCRAFHTAGTRPGQRDAAAAELRVSRGTGRHACSRGSRYGVVSCFPRAASSAVPEWRQGRRPVQVSGNRPPFKSGSRSPRNIASTWRYCVRPIPTRQTISDRSQGMRAFDLRMAQSQEAGSPGVLGQAHDSRGQRQHQMSGPRGLIEGVFGGRFSRDFGELGGIWGVDRAAGI